MRTQLTGAMLIAASLLTGCSGDNADLQRFVAEVKARPAAPIEPIPSIAPYTPFTYDASARRGPFTPIAPERDQNPGNGLAPNLDRPREPLESFPLDALRMVGTISRASVTYALIQAPDSVIHRVRPGNHLGQNYGEVVAVAQDGVTLTEIVPDGTGNYVERPAAIAPQR